MRPVVTALVDTYNQERYIEQALVSVLEQGLSASELEVVVVDDGSTDKTTAIVRKFLPRIKHVRKKNGGQGSAFNAGWAETTSDIVSILDGDDWWAKGKLTTVLEHLERNPGDVAVSHAYYEVYEKSGETRICGPREEPDFLHLGTPEAALYTREHWNFLQPSALTVRRRLLERVMPIPESLVFCADSPITTAAMAMGARVLPQTLSHYRIHACNLHAGDSDDPVRLRRKLEMEDEMYSVLYPRLLGLGVPRECVSVLLDEHWINVRHRMLAAYGGSRLKTCKTEMLFFRLTYKNPTLAYQLYKYLVMVPATLLLPPRGFYQLRNWYGRRNVGRLRDWFMGTERTGDGPPSRAEKAGQGASGQR